MKVTVKMTVEVVSEQPEISEADDLAIAELVNRLETTIIPALKANASHGPCVDGYFQVETHWSDFARKEEATGEMDFFFREAWIQAHPFEKALFEKMRNQNEVWDWYKLYYQLEDGNWLCLTRGGIWANDDAFYVAYGRDKEDLLNVLKHSFQFFVDNLGLTTLIQEAKKRWNIDIAALSLDNWEVV